jgi:hypothetical protein
MEMTRTIVHKQDCMTVWSAIRFSELLDFGNEDVRYGIVNNRAVYANTSPHMDRQIEILFNAISEEIESGSINCHDEDNSLAMIRMWLAMRIIHWR